MFGLPDTKNMGKISSFKIFFILCAIAIFPLKGFAADVPTIAEEPNNSNLWFDTILDADIVSGNWTVGSSDTIAHPATINIGEIAHFAFYYENSEGWYVNQNGTKVACPDDLEVIEPVLCATAPIFVGAPNVRVCSINNVGSGASAFGRRDSQVWVYTCADSSCSAIAMNTNQYSGESSVQAIATRRGRPTCWDLTNLGETGGNVTTSQMRIPPYSWIYIIKAPYDGLTNELTADEEGSILLSVEGLAMDPGSQK